MAKHRGWRCPVAPKVPGKAVFAITRNPLKLKVSKVKQRWVLLSGGPWTGLKILTRVMPGDYTLPVKIGALHGRYLMEQQLGVWQNV